MDDKYLRWVLPDLSAAINWCKDRNSQGFGCTFYALGENITTNSTAKNTIELCLTTAKELYRQELDGALAVKLTSLGASFNKDLARENLSLIFKNTSDLNVNIEIDMEGTPLVDYTIETALECAKQTHHVTLALQAYLDRTEDDIKMANDHDITVRLVKGAYLGDTDDFIEIQKRFKNLSKLLLESERHFMVGTHDPELIDWLKKHAIEQQDLIEFGFLKGLADDTKLELESEDWAVSEYIPFGKDSKAYTFRREQYLRKLEGLMRKPAP